MYTNERWANKTEIPKEARAALWLVNFPFLCTDSLGSIGDIKKRYPEPPSPVLKEVTHMHGHRIHTHTYTHTPCTYTHCNKHTCTLNLIPNDHFSATVGQTSCLRIHASGSSHLSSTCSGPGSSTRVSPGHQPPSQPHYRSSGSWQAEVWRRPGLAGLTLHWRAPEGG